MKHVFTLLAFALMSSGLAQLPDYVPSDGLVAWYNLDGSGTDLSDKVNHLNSISASSAVDRFGEVGQALHFDAQGSHLSCTSFDGIPNNTSHSISFWEKHELSGSNSGMILIQNGEIVDGAKLHYGYRGVESACPDGQCMGIDFWAVQHFTSSYPEGNWRHWVLSYDYTTLTTSIFLDADLISIQVMDDAFSGNFNEGITIGAFDEAYNYGTGFIGTLDDFGIWDRSLSEEEVLGLFLATSIEYGCTDPNACNYDSTALLDDSSCHFNCAFCQEGTTWNEETQGCIIANPSDTDFDGCIGMIDLLDLLSVFGTCAESESEEVEWSCGDLLEYQGYDYETVQIGEQCWFAENCRYLPYLNEVGDGSDTEPRYYILYEDHTDLLQAQESPSYLEYGALYNLPAVLVGEELCPSGWHIPNIQEWEELGAFASDLGPNSLKDESWGGGASGFDAKAAGHRANYGDYIREFEESDFWSVTVEPNCVNHVARLMSDEVDLMTSDLMLHCESGNSVRCIQDSE